MSPGVFLLVGRGLREIMQNSCCTAAAAATAAVARAQAGVAARAVHCLCREIQHHKDISPDD
jgi:ribosomal protein L12E/L44/L45/RPP1/RPP2